VAAVFKAFQPTIYVQLSPERVTLRNVKTGASVTSSPEIALTRGARRQVVAVGPRARKEESRTVQVVNPFVHPRTLLADFDAGQQLLRTLLRQLQGRSLLAAAPRLVLHLQDDPAGGFTTVEVRAFREMGLGAGAGDVLVWQGPNLTDEQLRARQLPKEGRVLSS
jgi:rod shape-determining protein MreB